MNATRVKTINEEFNIGNLRLKNRVVSAPMAGVTDKAYRIIAEAFGCGLIYTEMVSANAFFYNSERTKKMMDLSGETGPTTVQIFGNKPELIASAARAAQENGAHIVDINMGCPAPKVVKNFEGCALMTDLNLAGNIIDETVKAVTIPVTIKFRKGWDNNSVNAVELARIAEAHGAAAVAVHGRTRDQFYSGRADWDIIRRVKLAVKIPVIGNGDVDEPEDALAMLQETGCDGVMIGRGALGNPWLFKRTAHFLNKGVMLPKPSHKEKFDLIKRHLELVVEFKGEIRAIKEMRKHIAWYIKGLKDAGNIRELVNKAATREMIQIILDEYIDFLKQNE